MVVATAQAFVLCNLAFVRADEILGEHLRKSAPACLCESRVEIAVQLPVFALVPEFREKVAVQRTIESQLKLIGIKALGKLNKRTIHCVEKCFLVEQKVAPYFTHGVARAEILACLANEKLFDRVFGIR